MQKVRKQYIRILCISDTHSQTNKLKLQQYEGDIFICAGDFTTYCKQQDVLQFCQILDKLKFKHKIVICGNHEVHFDQMLSEDSKRKRQNKCRTSHQLKVLLSQHCTYLQHTMVEIMGLKIFGSPHAPRHGSTGFGYEQGQAQFIWQNIPKVDILITHTPPYGILDIGSKYNQHVGCKVLLKKVLEIKPKYHIFGHIHQSSGILRQDGIVFANVSQCGSKKRLIHSPYIFMLQTNQ